MDNRTFKKFEEESEGVRDGKTGSVIAEKYAAGQWKPKPGATPPDKYPTNEEVTKAVQQRLAVSQNLLGAADQTAAEVHSLAQGACRLGNLLDAVEDCFACVLTFMCLSCRNLSKHIANTATWHGTHCLWPCTCWCCTSRCADGSRAIGKPSV